MVYRNSPAAFRVVEYYEIESGVSPVKNMWSKLACRVEGVCLASSLGVDDAGSSTSLRDECHTACRVYRPAFQDNCPAFVCKMHPAEVAIDVRRFATPYGERHDEVALVDILDLVCHANERPCIDNLARLNAGKIRKSPAAVVKCTPAVVYIVINRDIDGI